MLREKGDDLALFTQRKRKRRQKFDCQAFAEKGGGGFNILEKGKRPAQDVVVASPRGLIRSAKGRLT